MIRSDTMSPGMPRLEGLADLVPLSVNQYQRMIAEGIIPEGAPVELIEGYLVAKDRGRGPGLPHGEAHACAVSNVSEVLLLALAPRWVVRCQLPTALGELDVPGNGSAPEPDVLVARGPRDRYLKQHPGPKDSRLVVEVSQSTLAYDRGIKKRIYAAASIPVYWIVNLVDEQLEVYTRPNSLAAKYLSQKILGPDEYVSLRLPKESPLTFLVRELLS